MSDYLFSAFLVFFSFEKIVDVWRFIEEQEQIQLKKSVSLGFYERYSQLRDKTVRRKIKRITLPKPKIGIGNKVKFSLKILLIP